MSEPGLGSAGAASAGGAGAVDADTASCVAFVLTGEFGVLGPDAVVASHAVLAPHELVEQLAAAGWNVEQIAALRDRVHAVGERWPIPLPSDVHAPGGAARFHAWVADVVAALGLDSHDGGVRDASQPQDAETRRLLADRPPHFGSVG